MPFCIGLSIGWRHVYRIPDGYQMSLVGGKHKQGIDAKYAVK